MKDEKDMSLYVAHLLISGHPFCLGVVVYRHILTCGHILSYFSVDKSNPLKVNCIVPCEEPTEYYAQSIDCSLDFMVLGEEPLYTEIENSPIMPDTTG